MTYASHVLDAWFLLVSSFIASGWGKGVDGVGKFDLFGVFYMQNNREYSQYLQSVLMTLRRRKHSRICVSLIGHFFVYIGRHTRELGALRIEL